ncbi:hypothetical protein ACWC9T_12770 [Kitasatospora sp. NPDC001159]
MLTVPQAVGDLGGQFVLLIQLTEACEHGFGGPPPELTDGLLVPVLVNVQLEPPGQPGQAQTPDQQGEQHHAEGDEDQPAALGEVRAGVQGERDGEGQGDGGHAVKTCRAALDLKRTSGSRIGSV